MNALLAPLAFERPLWLLLIPLCIAAFALMRRVRRKRFAAYADPQLLYRLLAAPARRRRISPALVAALLLALAVSGPYIAGAPGEKQRPALDLVLVLDVSPSMLADDVTPNRLQRARMKLHDLLARRAGDRAALIAFSAHAYRVLPLTYDLALLHGYIDALDGSLTRHHGSNIVQALEIATQTLASSPAGGRAIVLLSDGEAGDPAAVSAAATRLAQRGIPVFALGIGGGAGVPVPAENGLARGPGGELHLSRLDRALLSDLAARSGGRYADARTDDADLEYLQAGLARLEAGLQARPDHGGRPLHPWLLVAALALLLWQGRRYRHALPAWVLIPALTMALPAMLAPSKAVASAIETEQQAHRALLDGRYREATDHYRAMGGYRGDMGVGAAAFRQEHWNEALISFRQAAATAASDEERALAWYNEATTLARMERLTEAMERLDQVLVLHPNHARAALNRELLQRALEQRRGLAPDAAPRLRDDADTVTGNDAVRATETPAGGGEAGKSDRAGEIMADSTPMNTFAVAATDGEGAAAAALRSAGESAFVPPGAVPDDPRVVLRHRFMLMDARRLLLPETSPW